MDNQKLKTILRMQGGFCMERKFEIPKMSKKNIVKWYSTIKPIVQNKGTPTYLRELSDSELEDVSYTWLNKSTDYGEVADFTKLSVLADVKMLHSFGYHGFFKPSVGEVIRQIPKEYLEKVIAFEIIDGGIGMNTTFKAELNAGFHVSIVRLYQAKDATNVEAQPIDIYPNKKCKTPIGMTKKEFHAVKIMFGQEF